MTFIAFLLLFGSVGAASDAFALKLTRREMNILKQAKHLRKGLFKRGNVRFKAMAERIMRKARRIQLRRTAGL